MQGSGSNFLLSEPSDSNRELSFSASTDVKHTAPAVKWQQRPKDVQANNRASAVSFRSSDNDELSFTCEDSGRDAPPLAGIEQQHAAEMEHIHRNNICDEENAFRQHLRRLCATDRVRVEAEAKLAAAKALEKKPPDTSVESVAPAMVRYVNHLKSVSADDTVERLRNERAAIARELARHESAARQLSEEVEARKQFTSAAREKIEQQVRDRAADINCRVAESAQLQRDRIVEAANTKRNMMHENKEQRLKNLQVRRAFMALHGDYESKLEAADALREVRLASVGAKVVTQHSSDAAHQQQEIDRKVKEKAAARRAEAEALAARQHDLLQQRVVELGELRSKQRLLESELSETDRRQHIEALRRHKEASQEFERVERERERAIFLNRMTCNHEFNAEVERLREKRREEISSQWKEKRSAAYDKQHVASTASQLERQNLGKQRVLDRLMIEEARLISDAKSRLGNRQAVETHQLHRMTLMEDEERNKHKVLEQLYCVHSPAATSAHHSPDPDDERVARQPSALSGRVSNAKLKEEAEAERLRESLSRKFPPRRSVLPPPKFLPSLAFAAPTTLRNPPTSNVHLVELARRLYELENSHNDSRADVGMGSDERKSSRLRLTRKTAAQEAQRFAHLESDVPTIHDSVPPQRGVSSRLYDAPAIRSPLHSKKQKKKQRQSSSPSEDDYVLKSFVQRFYSEPIRQHEAVVGSCVANALNAAPLPKGPKMTDKEVRNIVDRLYSDEIRHFSPATERRLRDAEDRREESRHCVSDRVAVERFYTSPLEHQREVMQKLDERFL